MFLLANFLIYLHVLPRESDKKAITSSLEWMQTLLKEQGYYMNKDFIDNFFFYNMHWKEEKNYLWSEMKVNITD